MTDALLVWIITFFSDVKHPLRDVPGLGITPEMFERWPNMCREAALHEQEIRGLLSVSAKP